MVSEDVKAYVSSLADLTFNSKPLINMLTMLADENVAHAAEIVDVVEDHLAKVKTDVKLPVLYLIDCIVKNVGGPYNELFSRNIVATFCNVFRTVDEKTRAEMFKLRQTWNEVFSSKKLYAIDVQIRVLDPAWPVTAPVPKNCIHLNPKFLKNPSGGSTSPKSMAMANVPSSNADPATLDMQQQLIQKQKELLELQQKKLELELLQTKVRLREQISANTHGGAPAGIPQNVLLKPEVAKQLLSPIPSKIPTLDIKSSFNSVPATKNQRQLQTANNGPKIQPANSARVAAAINRPIRDPRLLRQQQNQQSEKQSQNTANTNVQIENKNNSDSSNKIVNSKTSVRDIQNDPRLKNINDNVPTQKFTDTNKPKSKISPKSRSERNQSRSSRAKGSDDSKSSKGSSSSSLDSPKKSKTEKSSPSKSPSSRGSGSRREMSSPKSKLFKSSREPKISKSDTALPIFKDVKNSKNRNYMRRNRSPQFSPEMTAQDIDLRLNGPPEKQARLLPTEKNIVPPSIVHKELTPPTGTSMDVDLRQIPATVGKKRPSVDSEDTVPNKKSRTEIFDELFGNEDVDLRKLSVPTPDRPPTPPPPIISSSEKPQETETQLPKSDLETVRAKLAANLKKSNSPLKKKAEDEDLRISQVSSSTDISNKIIISKADGDKIKEGGMNSIQQKQLMNKIIAQIEAQKLKEAKQQNNEENIGNISLTPISDDELDTDFNEEGNKGRIESPVPPIAFGDKDERMLMPQQPMGHPPDDHFNQRFGRDMRRGGAPNWRGVRGRRHWEGPHQRPPLRPWMQQPPMNQWAPGMFRPPFPDMDQNERRSPDGFHDIIIESASQEDIKTITIDGLPRDIRYYDEVAIIFMNWDDPREISFQDGTRMVTFNDTDMYMMNFNEPYREYRIGERLHKVRLGGPSREIYIDYKPYECYFGGPGITIDLEGNVTMIKLDGPPPQVKIGESRTDLVAGKIKLIIDAKTIIPIFLDSRVQTFTYNGEQHTVQFLPGLKNALINNEHFEVQFGGLPKPVMLKDKRHYIRFSVLPKALKQGRIKVKGLESEDVNASPLLDDNMDANEPALPIPQRVMKAYDPNISPDNSSSSNLFQNVLQQQNLQNLDFLTNAISTTEQPSNTYQVEASNLPTQQTENTVNPTNLFSMTNINDLFQKLVASGMVTTSATVPVKENAPPVQNHGRDRSRHGSRQSKKHPPLKPVSFDNLEQLKVRQGALYDKLYVGMQCSSCGMRFPPEQSLYYSQHLDWHFRQNRRGKKNARVAASRKWYYIRSDWAKYEEIEDLDEREKNFFDQQQQQAESTADEAVEEAEMPSITADPELQDICDVCGDKFDIFFHEDKEEWHLKNAVRDEDKIYHPICFEEYQQSLQKATLEQSELEEKQGSNEESQIPGIEIVLDDDEDMDKAEDIIDEVILDESDESKLTASEEKKEEEPLDYEDEDDDVIIKEETIEQIILDDDDDKMDDEEISVPSPIPSSRSSSPKPKERPEVIDDGFVDVNEGLLMLQNGGPIKVKSEPIDDGYLMGENAFDTTLEDEDMESAEVEEAEEPKEPEPEQAQSQSGFVASIDGNLEMDTSAPTPVSNVCGKIKINIHKPLPVLPPRNNNKDMSLESDLLPESVIDPSQPLPPGEEPILLKLKPALQGVDLKKMPRVQKGSELSGMCTIM